MSQNFCKETQKELIECIFLMRNDALCLEYTIHCVRNGYLSIGPLNDGSIVDKGIPSS